MSEGLNRVLLIGHLGQEPDLQRTQTGKAVLNLSVATTTSFYDADKERREYTEWHKVVVWGKRAEALNDALAKGMRVFVEGSIKTNTWEDREGNKRRDVVINASVVTPLGATDKSDRPQADTEKPARPQHRETYAPNGPPSDEDKWF